MTITTTEEQPATTDATAANGAAAKTRKKRSGPPPHAIAAAAVSRSETATINRYLELVTAQNAPKRRGRHDANFVRTRHAKVVQLLDDPATRPVKRLELISERQRLDAELKQLDQGDEVGAELEDAEKEFVAIAAGFGQRKGITYSAWREIGVPTDVLKTAGITR